MCAYLEINLQCYEYEDFIGLHFQVFHILHFVTLLKVEICHGVTFYITESVEYHEKRSDFTLF